MNLDIFNIYAKVDDLVQIVGLVPGAQNVTIRIGRLVFIDDDVIILKPHNDPLITKAYGGDVEVKYDIHRLSTINEILVLFDDEDSLKKVIKNNIQQESLQ